MKKAQYVFVNLWGSPTGEPMSYASVDRLVRRLRDRTGIAFSPHLFRHSYATGLLRLGSPPRSCSTYSGTPASAPPSTPTPRLGNCIRRARKPPQLDDVTEQQIRELADRYPKGARRRGLIKISRVLAHKGIIATPLHGNDALRGPRPDTLSTVPPSWLAWAQRWRALSTHEPGTIRTMFSTILIAGRWAAERHPEAPEPQLWTRDIAAEYVADTLHAVHGQWAGHNRNTTKKGQPLSAVGKVQRIDSLRGFFCDLIDWEWVKPKFDPRKVLCGPVSVRAQIGPNPRIIDEVTGPSSWPPG